MIEVVAEFTTNHFGHLGLLLRMVDKAVEAGATSVKMQKKYVEDLYTKEKLDRPYPNPFGHAYRDYRTMCELSSSDWERFDDRCKHLSTRWFCTVQSIDALLFMLSFDLYRYKVASSNARNHKLLRFVAQAVPEDREIVVSLAGCTLEEIEHIVTTFENHRKLWLLHCVAEYPCPPERLRLGNIPELIKRFKGNHTHIGYSGHETGWAASAVAMELGAEMVERHFCLSRHSFVHHIECSLLPFEFARLVQFAKGGRADRKTQWPELPAEALESDFGMTEKERAFLENQTHGTDYVGQKSTFGDSVRPR